MNLITAYILVLLSFFSLDMSGQITIWSEDFEDNGNSANGGTGRYNSPNDFYDSNADDDYWGRVRASDRNYFLTNTTSGFIANSANIYAGQNGDFYYAGEDLDDTGGTIGAPDGLKIKNIIFPNININGATNLEFIGLFAAGDNASPCGSNRYDIEDHIYLYYNIDGTGEFLGMCFSPDLECNIPGDITNEPLYFDSDCDGDGGGGVLLTNNFGEFNFSIPGVGTNIDFRIEVHMNEGGEEVAFDFFRLTSSTPLPVELISFFSQKEVNNVKLSWQTATEINNDRFEVEVSSNGVDFHKVGEVKGKGSTVEQQDYSFIHENPRTGISYFRLKQIDFDGQFKYSKVISVSQNSGVDEIGNFYPNPGTSGVLNFDYSAQSKGKISVIIYDTRGQLIYSQNQDVDNGLNNLNFDIAGLSKGLYIIQVDNERSIIYRKYVIE